MQLLTKSYIHSVWLFVKRDSPVVFIPAAVMLASEVVAACHMALNLKDESVSPVQSDASAFDVKKSPIASTSNKGSGIFVQQNT